MEANHSQGDHSQEWQNVHAPVGEGNTHIYDVGVLFVHGIGQQIRGDTLVRFGEPLVHWLNKWIKGATSTANPEGSQSPGSSQSPMAQVSDAFLLPIPGNLAPPHCTVKIGFPNSNGEAHHQSWLMAESWWADAFMMPSYGNLVHWGCTVVPWIIAANLGTQIRRLWIGAWRHLGKFIFTLCLPLVLLLSLVIAISAALFSIVVLVLLLLLSVLALLPISGLRSIVLWIQQMLSAILGDCHVFLESPIQAAAIKSHVARDLEWLAAQCRSVAVVAHSQGGAVSYETLCQGAPPNLHLLFTLGSGLNTLAALRAADPTRELRAGWFVLAGVSLLLFSIWLSGYGPLPTDLTSPYWAWVARTFGFLLFVLGMLFAIFKGATLDSEQYDPKGRFGDQLNRQFTWMDYYASADPVPNGPLFDERRTPYYLKANSVEVYNRSAILSDHTTYWDNPDGFVSAVVEAVSRLGGVTIVTDAKDTLLLQLALYRRRWRVRWLLAVRMFTISTVLGLPLALFSQLAAIGAHVKAQSINAQKMMPLGLKLEQEQLYTLPESVLGFATVVTLSLIGYGILFAVWKLWEKEDINDFFSHADFRLHTPVLSFCFLTAVFVEIVGVVPVFTKNWTDAGWDSVKIQHITFSLLLYFSLRVLWTSLRQIRLRSTQWGLVERLDVWQEAVSSQICIALIITTLIVIPSAALPFNMTGGSFEDFLRNNGLAIIILIVIAVVAELFIAVRVRQWFEKKGAVGDKNRALVELLINEDPQRAAETLARIARGAPEESLAIYERIFACAREHALKIRATLDHPT